MCEGDNFEIGAARHLKEFSLQTFHDHCMSMWGGKGFGKGRYRTDLIFRGCILGRIKWYMSEDLSSLFFYVDIDENVARAIISVTERLLMYCITSTNISFY